MFIDHGIGSCLRVYILDKIVKGHLLEISNTVTLPLAFRVITSFATFMALKSGLINAIRTLHQ